MRAIVNTASADTTKLLPHPIDIVTPRASTTTPTTHVMGWLGTAATSTKPVMNVPKSAPAVPSADN